MAFGNPYGDERNIDILAESVERLANLDVKNITLADVIGVSQVHEIAKAYSFLTKSYPEIEFGFHLHSRNSDWYEKVDAAYMNGCLVFDGVLGGAGGCPMADHELVANLETNKLIDYFKKNNVKLSINEKYFQEAGLKAKSILLA